MDKCNEYLKELRQLYLNFDSLKDAPFIFFSLEAKDLLSKIKINIENSYVDKSTDSFSKYSITLKEKLKELSSHREIVLIIRIEKWLIDYNYEYKRENLCIESILNLDPEEGISRDLSFPINLLQGDSSSEKIYYLQEDFLNFCKSAIVEDILNFLNKKHKTVNSAIEKSKVENFAWFKVGLLIATGKMDILKKECNNNAHEIARRAFPENPDKYRPTISGSSVGEKSKGAKNIFNNVYNLKSIYDHCENNGITMTDKFKSLINSNQGN